MIKSVPVLFKIKLVTKSICMYLLWGFYHILSNYKTQNYAHASSLFVQYFLNFPLWHACGSFKNVFQIEITFLLLKMRLISAA